MRSIEGGRQVWDPVRKKWVAPTPEEHVRQLLLKYLIDEMHYPAALIAVERGINLGHTMLRFDLVIYHRDTDAPWMLIECKSPDVPLSNTALQQLLQYQGKLPQCRYWLLTNGQTAYCADAGNPLEVKWLDALPAY